MLKLVNRTRSPGSRFTFCADLRHVASHMPSLLLLYESSLPFSLFFLRSCLPRKPLHPRFRSSDNGGLALSLWFIASFDCQVHAGESTRPSSSPYVRDASSLMLRLQLRSSHSALHAAATFPLWNLRWPCALVIAPTRLDHSHIRSEFSDILFEWRVLGICKVCDKSWRFTRYFSTRIPIALRTSARRILAKMLSWHLVRGLVKSIVSSIFLANYFSRLWRLLIRKKNNDL